MGDSQIMKTLLNAMEEFEIIDCHEHLPPEKKRTETEVDVFTLFSVYTGGDLSMAGMSKADYDLLSDRRIPLEARWKMVKPYWERIRFGSYARALLISVRKFYGFDDINDTTYIPLSEAMQKANKPGIYEKVLRDACGIRVALTQCGMTELGSPLLVPVMPLIYDVERWQSLHRPQFAPEAKVRSLDDYIEAVRSYVVRVKSEGAVGLKMVSNPYGEPDRKKALEAFELLRSGKQSSLPLPNPLRDYIVDETVSIAEEQDLVIAVHTGYWGDFRKLDPLHMIPILQRHPEARFDIYHLGYPWVRESLMLGKQYPNVWLNFCWTHIISQHFATQALVEAIDLIPTNKILAFGGDYLFPVEKVYGHLTMAREDIATALAERVKEGRMTDSQALEIARKWFWDNPKELYRLELK